MRQFTAGTILGLIAFAVHATAQCDLAHLARKNMSETKGVGYAASARTADNTYQGATSRGDGWEIRWKGPYNQGPQAIDAMRAALDHLTYLQRTTSASTANAKLIVHLIKAIEEHDGIAPSVGGDLNNLIPKE
jgi:hypothetical protein